ncbi:MAG: FKBP-type peptidyl-prolyl cis-trans isomerase [Kofleriaceae bacterium]
MGAKSLLVAVVFAAMPACQDAPSKPVVVTTVGGSGSGPRAEGRPTRKSNVEQIPAPADVGAAPADAIRTSSGLAYKLLHVVPGAPKPGRNDTVNIMYTGWTPAGDTFYTTRTRGKPMAMPLGSAAPGFAEALGLLGTGDKALLWIPAAIGYRARPQADAIDRVYEVELVSIDPAPPVPPDVAAPPPEAKVSPSGVASLVIRPGTGKEKPQRWDDVTYVYTQWDVTGKMLESTEMRKRPSTGAPFRLPPGIEEALTGMVVGERSRFWIPGPIARKSEPPAEGTFTFEIEVSAIQHKEAPPPTPPDVAAPPADAKRTASGLAYKVLRAGAGKVHPTATQGAKVVYTGWTRDGRMFESSVLTGRPAEVTLNGVITGWTEALQLMSVGDRYRIWIPEELAYKGAPGKPQGMLVFELELLEIVEAPTTPLPPAGLGRGSHGRPRPGFPPGGMRGGHGGHDHPGAPPPGSIAPPPGTP